MVNRDWGVAKLAKHAALKAFGARLQMARNSTDLTQEAVAERLGVSSQTVRNWESGRTEPSRIDKERMAALYHKPVVWFFGENAELDVRVPSPVSGAHESTVRPEDFQPSRLRQARIEAGLTLEKAAEAVNTSFNTIWRYEAGKRKPSGPTLYALAALYGKPVGWFFSERHNNNAPAMPPVTQSAEDRTLEGIVTEIREYIDKRLQYRIDDDVRGDKAESQDIERLTAIAAAAGSGTTVFDETTVERVPFLTSWLQEHSLNPANCQIIGVRGPSMEPTLPDGCSIIVDRSRRDPHEGRMYIVRTEEGLVVKRLGKDKDGRWEARSENPAWEPKLLAYGSDIVGEIRWSAMTY